MSGPRRAFGLLALGAALFTTYGSLVPFDFHAIPPGEAVAEFARAMTGRLRLASRADAVVNVLLGVPLGFGLLGLFRAGRVGRRADVLCGLALLPACALFAAAVEFGQVYLPERFCSGADVWCQTLGAAAGMAGWVLVGRGAAGPVGAVWDRFARGGPAGRLLPGYVLLLVLVQALPLDLDPNPKDVYRRLKNKARLVPFGEFRGADPGAAWAAAAKLLRLGRLFVPAGLLAAHLRGRTGANGLGVFVGAVVVAGGTEAMQLGIESRSAGGSDVVAGVIGVMAGWAAGRLGGRAAAPLGVVWAAGLFVAYWAPFRLTNPAKSFDWLPGRSLEAGDPAFVLEDLLTKLALFAPLGAAAGAARATAGGVGRLSLAGAAGLLVATAVEIGQQYLPHRTPCLTDVLLGGAGAAAGWWATSRVRGPNVS